MFCNGDDSCNAGACEHTGSPCGGPCDEDKDTCLCEAPLVEQVAQRYLRITPQPPGSGPQAILIQADCPGAVARYVDPPFAVDIEEDDLFDENAAKLGGPVAVLGGFLTPEEWGELYVFGADLEPDTTYIVWGDCGSPGNPGLSDSTVVTTPRFGDSVGHFITGVGWDEPDGIVNILDVLAGIESLINSDFGPQINRTDLIGFNSFGTTCAPDQQTSILDVFTAVRAFQGLSYSEVREAITEECDAVCP